MKPRATTLAKRFGFQDPDLTSPKHDEIILALLNKERMLAVLRETLYDELKVHKPWIGRCREDKNRYKDNSSWIQCTPLKEKAEQEWRAYIKVNGFDTDVQEDRSEKHCIMSEAGWRSRLSDCPKGEALRLATEEAEAVTMEDLFTPECLDIKTEHVVANSYNNFVIGFIDLRVVLTWPSVDNQFWRCRVKPVKKEGENYRYHNHSAPIYIEVKTDITSFGETMRQINMYRNSLEERYDFILVTTSTGFKKAFESQGVHVYEWERIS